MELLSCSIDGTVAFMDFSKEEIGQRLSKDDLNSILESMYGKGLSLHAAATKGTQIIESAAMLNLQRQKTTNNVEVTPVKSNMSSSSFSRDGTPFKPTDKQIETRTADGKRRITPIFLSPQPEIGEVPLPFCSNSNIEFHSSSEKSKIVVEKQDRVTAPGFVSPSSGSKSMSSPPQTAAVISAARDIFNVGSKDMQNLKADNETTPEKVASKFEPAVVLEKLSPSIEQALQPDKEEEEKKASEKESSSKKKEVPSSAKDKHKSRLNLKRKFGDEKRKRFLSAKRGRPFKTDQAARESVAREALSESPSDRPILGNGQSEQIGSATTVKESKVVNSGPDLRLPAMKIDKYQSHAIESRPGSSETTVVDVENGVDGGTMRLNRIRCQRAGRLVWEQIFSSKICAVAGSRQVICCGCVDGTVSLFCGRGRRVLPMLITGAPPSFMHCTGHHVMVITTKGLLYVWNVQTLKTVIEQKSLSPIMTDKDKIEKAYLTSEGVPIVLLASCTSYSFSIDIGCWILITSGEDKLAPCSKHQPCVPSKLKPLGPLSSLHEAARTGEQTLGSTRVNANTRQSLTVSHLESQVVVSLSLKSASEYKFWIETYIRYLAQEGIEEKLRDVCNDLLGPVYRSRDSTSWSKHVLGLDKHAILRNVLPVIGSDLKFQRLYTEYKDQLDLMTDS